MVHFVIFEKWTSNYEISISTSILCVHYVLWYIKLFCQKVFILSVCEVPVYFFASSILSKMLNFVIFREGRVVFSLFQNCQKWPILSLSERLVYFFASSILSNMLNCVIFWEASVFYHIFNFVKNGPFCHFWIVDFKLWDKYKYTMCTLCVVMYQTIL